MRFDITVLLLVAAAWMGFACSDQELHVAPEEQLPAIEVDPLDINFGIMETGSQLYQDVTITSVGPVDLEIYEFQLDAPVNFELITDEETFVLSPGEEKVVTIGFTSMGDGEDSGVLHIINDDPANGDAEVTLNGAGIAPSIFIDPPIWDFGEHDVGCEVVQDVYVRSVGSYSLTIHDFSFLSTPSLSAMSLYTDELYNGMEMEPGASALVQISFIPEDVVSYQGTLLVTSDDPREPSAEGTQTGLGSAGAWFHDHFVQEGNNWTDILWVVDNSCSMEDQQGQLGDDFVYFHGIINTAGVDYRIATVTTDNDTFVCAGCAHGFIDHATPNGAAQFEQNCHVGTNGSGTERGLKFGYDALVKAINEVAPNDHYWREDAGLRVVFVSDEPDQSGSWSSYLSNYQGFKNNPDHVILSAICGTNGVSATSCNGGGGAADAGTGYVDAVNATGGILASICDSDWSQALTNLGWLSISLADTFPLSEEPVIPSTITVEVNGVQVTNGWYYDAGMMSVVFEPGYVPEDGDVIDIDYGIPGNCEG